LYKNSSNISMTILIFQRALSFLNNDGSLRHNNVSIWSTFVNASGEWKLGGLEYVQAVDSNNQHNQTIIPVKIPPALEIYDPPEKSDPSKVKHSTKW
jgi:SCY1-like protein 1